MKKNTLGKMPASLGVMALTLLLTGQSLMAGQPEMSVFDGYKSSEAALDGNYDKAIELAITAIDTRNSYRRTVEATTLCVAYTKSNLLVKAETYCDLAILASRKAAKTRAANTHFTTDDNKPISIVKVTKNNLEVLSSVMTKQQRTAEL